MVFEGVADNCMLVVIVAMVVIVIWFVKTLNCFRRLQVKNAEALSDIDVALSKRFDMLTKMVAVVKSHTKFEQDTIFKTVRMRRGMSMDERSKVDAAMDYVEGQIRLTCENYPRLAASESFVQLQIGIMDAEEHLQAARRAYNGNASTLNQLTMVFPSNIVANICGIRQAKFFVADSWKKEDVDVRI